MKAPSTPAEEEDVNRYDEEDTRIYSVVVNHEEQYSIWFSDREIPLGWREVGKTGTKPECLSYIEEIWTDMRPLSLRKQMDGED
jgi:MbtH protein